MGFTGALASQPVDQPFGLLAIAVITSVRVATRDDLSEIAALVDAQELGVDPHASNMTEAAALEFLGGYIDPSDTYLLSIDGEAGFSAIVNLHPDAGKAKFFTDVYVHPSIEDYGQVVNWAIERAAAEHGDWALWPAMNALDVRLQDAWSQAGFRFLRKYNTMRAHFSGAEQTLALDGVEIRALDTSLEEELRRAHAVQQDAFAGHFDFTPRTFEVWNELMMGEDSSSDKNGFFLATLNGEPAGICICSDEIAENQRGYIWILGVAHAAQGNRIGEALLRHAFAYFQTRGFGGADLTVDTGNESGALRLYEKVGFRAESAWMQMANENWNSMP